jgi:site-specific recombinase XerD
MASKAREIKAERVVGPLKTKKARRTVPLPSWARAALAAHRESLAATPHPAMLLFTTEKGTPIRFSNFGRRHLAKLVKRAGLPRETSLHTLRHTAATLLIGGGTDVRSVQAILGHARASTTLDTYSDAIARNVEAAMAGLDSLVEQASEA